MLKPLEVIPLSDVNLEGAAGLVTACYREERRAVPVLPARYNMKEFVLQVRDKEYISIADALRGMQFRAEKKWKESIDHYGLVKLHTYFLLV